MGLGLDNRLFVKKFTYVIFCSGTQSKILTRLRWPMMEVASPLSSSPIGVTIFELIPCGMFLRTRIELLSFENIAFGGFFTIVPSSLSE